MSEDKKNSVEMLRIGYLIPCYPAVSHTFVLREILALREGGLEIGVASINSSKESDDGHTEIEKSEQERTFYVKREGLTGALAACLRTLVTTPVRFLSTLLYALRLGGTDVFRAVYNIFYFVESAIVGEWLRKNGFSHLHVQFGSEVANVGLFVRKMFDVTLSYTFHGPDEFYEVGRFYIAEKVRTADFIVCISSYTRSQLMRLSEPGDWEKLHLIHLGVEKREQALPYADRKAGPVSVLSVGRLTRTKGQFVLLKAIAGLLAEGVGLTLTIVGNGPDRDLLEEEAESLGLRDTVSFAGSVNQDSILQIYADADIFVSTSFAEGLPVVLMEAMSFGVPVVGPAINGIPELIEDGIDGLLVPASDQEGFAAAIRKLAMDSDLRRKLARNGLAKVTSEFDLAKNAARLGDLFRSELGAEPEGAPDTVEKDSPADSPGSSGTREKAVEEAGKIA